MARRSVGLSRTIEGGKGSAVTVGVRRCRGERQALICQARLVREEMHLPANGTERLQLDVSEAEGGIGKQDVQDRYLHLERARSLRWCERSWDLRRAVMRHALQMPQGLALVCGHVKDPDAEMRPVPSSRSTLISRNASATVSVPIEKLTMMELRTSSVWRSSATTARRVTA